ncbi:MAG TPA: hypothetical protein VIK62_06960 [Verrucomicrobiae bacterium]
MIVLLILLNAGLVKAADFAATNQMPSPVRVLMEQAGYVMVQTNSDIPAPDTNSLRYLPPIKKSRLRPLERPVQKNGWNFWDNTGVKYIHRNHDPMNLLAPAQPTPYSTLTQLEYDITYSFDF